MSPTVLAAVRKTPEAELAYVLDDESQIGTLVSRMLASLRYSARPFSTVQPFITEVKLAPPRLVVLDLALGQADAVEVLRQLELIKYRGKVLLISGRDASILDEVRRIGEQHGLAMLPPLVKPFAVKDLRVAVSSEPVVRSKAPKSDVPQSVSVDLAEALAKNWLEVWYQPKIDLKSLLVCGAEALVRARHPDYGIVLPGNLLPPSGDPLYRPLSRFVLRQAVTDWAQFAHWKKDLKVAINVPASVLSAPDFIGILRGYLPAQPFPSLILEITEDEIIGDPEVVRELATRLKIYGVGLSIDDFGAAYSSLARLRDLPFIELKLDRSFVSSCATNEHNRALCRAAIELAHEFRASACAEGVEDPRDLEALVAMGCDTAQGFLFAKPMPAADFTATLCAPKSDGKPPLTPGPDSARPYRPTGGQGWPIGAALSQIC
jgi:EAL domain-containing protein (putative c-di-GMP-specific phosphodiesterase class I)/ActR/RegA family two-component response regulator